MSLETIRNRLIPTFPPPDPTGGGQDQLNYAKIWRWTVLATLSVSIIPLVILAVWDLFQYERALKAEVMFPIRSQVSNAKGSIFLFLDERKSVLNFIARDNQFDALTDQARLRTVFQNLKSALGDVIDLGVVTADGVQAAYVGPYELRGVNYRNERWFKEVIIRGVYISDVFLGFRDFPHIVIAIKREDERGNFYILRTTVDTQKFNGIIEALNIRASSDAFLVNREGVIQTPTRYHGKALQKIGFSLPPVSSASEVAEIRDADGRRAIVGYTRIEGTPFNFIVTKHPDELRRNQETFLGQLLGFLTLSIAVIVIVILRISTIMVNNIQEADRKRIRLLHEIEYTAKMASIGRLAAGVAHEINNPLAIINEKAGLLKDLALAENPKMERFVKLADSILAAVKRCSAITSRLLSFARHIDVQVESIDLRSLLEEVLSFLGREAEYRGLQIELKMENDVPAIQNDRGQLQQAFLNIVNNAFAAVSDGGRIAIDIRLEGPDRVRVAIEDNGIGISPENMTRIFDPFFTTKGRKGTGLGLSITYGIIQKLGGKIEVKSEVSKGTNFVVLLPIARS